MCFPARAARMHGMVCQWSGVAMTTASRPGRARSSRKSPNAFTPLNSPLSFRWEYRFSTRATASSSLSLTTSLTATTSTSGRPTKESRWLRPITPTPMNPSVSRSLLAAQVNRLPKSGKDAERAAVLRNVRLVAIAVSLEYSREPKLVPQSRHAPAISEQPHHGSEESQIQQRAEREVAEVEHPGPGMHGIRGHGSGRNRTDVERNGKRRRERACEAQFLDRQGRRMVAIECVGK